MFRKAFIIGAPLVAIAAAGVGYAAIPSASGVISACKKADGSVRLIDKEAGQFCLASQQLVEWNKQGPQGPIGPQGPVGPQGPQGPAGSSAGPTGYQRVIVESADNSKANCPAGKIVVGGGGNARTYAGNVDLDVALIGSYQVGPGGKDVNLPYGWVVEARETAAEGSSWHVVAYAICVDAS
jgi:hypothetical protein